MTGSSSFSSCSHLFHHISHHVSEKETEIRTIVQAKEKPKTNQREIHRASEMSLASLLKDERRQRVVGGLREREKEEKERDRNEERERVRETEGRRHAEMGK